MSITSFVQGQNNLFQQCLFVDVAPYWCHALHFCMRSKKMRRQQSLLRYGVALLSVLLASHRSRQCDAATSYQVVSITNIQQQQSCQFDHCWVCISGHVSEPISTSYKILPSVTSPSFGTAWSSTTYEMLTLVGSWGKTVLMSKGSLMLSKHPFDSRHLRK